jgi:hypothetical protein
VSVYKYVYVSDGVCLYVCKCVFGVQRFYRYCTVIERRWKKKVVRIFLLVLPANPFVSRHKHSVFSVLTNQNVVNNRLSLSKCSSC